MVKLMNSELIQVLYLGWSYLVNFAITIIFRILCWFLSKVAIFLFKITILLSSRFSGSSLISFLVNIIMEYLRIESFLYLTYKTKVHEFDLLKVRLNEFKY